MKNKRNLRRKGWMALSAAAGAVSLFGSSARVANADTYSYVFNDQSIDFAFNPTDLTAATNWFDVSTTTYDNGTVPGLGASTTDIAQFDVTYTNFNATSSFTGIALTLSSAQITTWGGLNVASPANPNFTVNSGGTTAAFVMSLTGGPGLSIGSSGIAVAGTDTNITAPVTLAGSQTWNIQNIPLSITTTSTATPVLTNTQALTLASLNLTHSTLNITGGGNITVSGVVSDGGSVGSINMNSAGGVLTLNSADTYTGGTTLSAGAVATPSTTGFGAAGSAITFAGGSLEATGTTFNSLNAYNINGFGVNPAAWNNVPLNIIVNNGGNTFVVGQQLNGSSGSVTVGGSGVLQLTQTVNNYGGLTTIGAGATLAVPDLASLGASGVLNAGLVNNAGTLQLNLTSSATISGNTAGTGTLVVAGSNLNVNGATGTLLNNSFGMINASTLTFLPSTSSSPDIGTISSLNFNNGNLVVAPGVGNGNSLVFPTTTFTGGTNSITAGTGDIVFLGTVPTFASTGGAVITSIVRGTGTTGDTVVFNGPFSAAGTTSAFQVITVNGTLGAVAMATPYILSSGPNAAYRTGYATYGLSDWAVVSANTTGTSYIMPGASVAGFYTEQLASSSISTAVNTDVIASGQYRWGNNDQANSIRFNVPTGGLFNGDGNNIDQIDIKSGVLFEADDFLVTPNVGANNVLFSVDGTGTGQTSQLLSIGRSSAQDMVIWQNNTAGMLIFNTGIADTKTAGGSVSKAGPGILAINATSAYTGGTTISGGTIEIPYERALGFVTSPTTNDSLSLAGGTLFAVNSFNLDNISGATVAQMNVNVGFGGGNIVAGTGKLLNIDGSLSGSANLVLGGTGTYKEEVTLNSNSNTLTAQTNGGAGTIQLSSATNTYSGNATVVAGGLQLDGTFTSPSATVTMNSGTTLTGAGNFAGGVTLQAGNTTSFFPGDNGIGNLTIGSLSTGLNNGVTFSFLNASTPQPSIGDTLTVTNSLTMGGITSLALVQQNTINQFFGSGQFTLAVVPVTSSLATTLNGLADQTGTLYANGVSTTVANFTLDDPAINSTYALTGVNTGTSEVVLLDAGTSINLAQWNNATGGTLDWSTNPNWFSNNGLAPSGQQAIAIFPQKTTTGGIPSSGVTIPATTVILGVPQTVGALSFSNTNGYTLAPGTAGVLVLNNGAGPSSITVQAGNQAISAPTLLNAGGVNISETAGTTLAFSGGISGPGGISLVPNNNVLTNSGVVTLGGGATYNYGGSTLISLGTLQIGTGATSANFANTQPINLANNGTLAVDQPSGSTTISNNISGAGGITQAGAGTTLILTGTNAFSGPTNVNAGTLQYGGASAYGTSNLSALTVATGALVDLNGTNPVYGSISGGGVIDNVSAGGSVTLTMGANNTTTTFSGTIQNTTGTVGLASTSGATGLLVLSGTNTYTGPTTINGATFALRVNDTAAINPVSPVTIISEPGAESGALILGNGVTFANPISVANSVSEFVALPDGTAAAPAYATLSGPISVAGGGNQFRLGFNDTFSTLFMTGASTVGTNQIAFLTEGNIDFVGTGSLTVADSSSADQFTFGRTTSADGFNVVIANNASITNTGTNGLVVGLGTAVTSSSVTLQGGVGQNPVLNLGSGTFEIDNTTDGNQVMSYFLDGGTLTAGQFTMTPAGSVGAAATANIYFAGTVVTAGSSSNNFFPNPAAIFGMTISTGGFLFNTNGFNEVIQTANGFNSVSGDGGITKLGAGSVDFYSTFGNASNAQVPYTGPTIVDGGMLDFASSSQASFTATPYIKVLAGGTIGVESGSTLDTNFLNLMTNSNAPALQFGSLALSPADSVTNIDYTGTVVGAFNMTKPVSTSPTSFVNMAIGATANFNGTVFAPVVYTGSITPAHPQYILGGGGTLELATVTTGSNAATGVPIHNVGGMTTLLVENGGEVWLATTNTYTGATTVAAVNVLANTITGAMQNEYSTLGVSFLGESAGETDGSSLGTANPANPANLILDGGTLQYLGSGDTSTRVFTMTANGATIDASGTGPLNLTATGNEAYTFSTGSATFTLSGSYGSIIPAVGTVAAVVNVNTFDASLASPVGTTLNFAKNGTGLWKLAGTNQFASVSINNGMLLLGADSTTVFGPNTMPLNVNGTLDINGHNLSVGQLTGGGVVDDFETGDPAVTVGFGNGSSTFTGEIEDTLGTVSLSVVGTGNFTLSGSSNGTINLIGNNTYVGGTYIDTGSTLTLAGSNTSTLTPIMAGTGAIADAGLLVVNRTDNLSLANNVNGTGSFTKNGSGTLSLTGTNTYSGITTVGGGALIIPNVPNLPSGTKVVVNGNLDLLAGTSTAPQILGNVTGTGNLNIGVTGTAAYTQLASGSGAHTMGGLNVASGSTLDITNNKLVINFGAATDPIASIVAAITSGAANNGSENLWTGTGITSSLAKASNGKFSIGYLDGNLSSDNTTNNPISANQIVLKYTLTGDAFLENTVGFDDLLTVAQNYGAPSGKDWAQGSFDYTGSVGFGDLLSVAQSYGSNSGVAQGSLGNGGILSLAWQSSGAAVTTPTVSAVPEPGSLSLIAAGAGALLARRRRRSAK